MGAGVPVAWGAAVASCVVVRGAVAVRGALEVWVVAAGAACVEAFAVAEPEAPAAGAGAPFPAVLLGLPEVETAFFEAVFLTVVLDPFAAAAATWGVDLTVGALEVPVALE